MPEIFALKTINIRVSQILAFSSDVDKERFSSQLFLWNKDIICLMALLAVYNS